MNSVSLLKKFLINSSYQEYLEPVDQSHGVAKYSIERSEDIEIREELEAKEIIAIFDATATLSAFIDSELSGKVFELIQTHRFIVSFDNFTDKDDEITQVVEKMLNDSFVSGFINVSCRDSIKRVINETKFSDIDVPYYVEWSV